MDRNQAIGLILISILVIIYFQFFAPEPQPVQPVEEVQTEQPVSEQQAPQLKEATVIEPTELDSATKAERASALGILSSGAEGEAKEIVLENEDLKITLTSHGANVKEALLKEYFTWDKKPLVLADSESHLIEKIIEINNAQVNLGELYYQVDQKEFNDTSQVTFSILQNGTPAVEHIYTLPSKGFQMGYELRLLATGNIGDDTQFSWTANLKRIEEGLDQSRQYTTINYYDADGFDDLSASSSDEEVKKLRVEYSGWPLNNGFLLLLL